MYGLIFIGLLVIVANYSALADSLDIQLTDHKMNKTDSNFCTAETATFGATLSFYALQGILVNAQPINACQPLLPPPFPRNDTRAWVALVARDHLGYGCSFGHKILNVQTAGYDAALVYNYEDVVFPMDATDVGNRVRIPAAMVTYSCGVNMQTRLAYSVSGDRYTLSFDIPFPFDFHIYVISFAVIIGVCLLLSMMVWGIKFYRDWRRVRRNRLPRSILKKIKVKKFEKGKDPYDCCAICLEDFEPGEKLRILPCNHAYHTKCVDQWLLKSRSTCPVCKRRVFPPSADSDDDENGGGGTSSYPSTSTGGVDASAGPSGLVAVAVAPSTSSESSSSQQHNERTPLLLGAGAPVSHSCAALVATASATAATTATVAASEGDGDGTFDNAALQDDSTVDEEETDVEPIEDATSATAGMPSVVGGGGGVSVEVFVHRSQDEGGKDATPPTSDPDPVA